MGPVYEYQLEGESKVGQLVGKCVILCLFYAVLSLISIPTV